MANTFRWKKYNIILIILCFLFIFIYNSVEAQNLVFFDQNSLSVTTAPNTSVTIPVLVNDINGLASWSLIIKFDQNVLTFDSLGLTGTLSDTYYDVPAIPSGTYDPILGGIAVSGLVKPAYVGSLPSETGILFDVVFQAGAGDLVGTSIALERVDDPGNLVYTSGLPVTLYTTIYDYVLTFDNPSFYDIGAGTFVLPLLINDATGLEAWNLSLTYDNTVLELVGVEPGTLISGIDPSHLQYNITQDVTPGIDQVDVGVLLDANEVVTGSGELLKFIFIGDPQWSAATTVEVTSPIDPGNDLGFIDPFTFDVDVIKTPVVALVATNYATMENDPNGGFYIPVTLSDPSYFPVTVDYTTVGGLAQYDVDFVGETNTQLVFNPGELNKNIIIGLIDDTIVEVIEDLTLTLSNPVNALLGTPSSATLKIHENDPLPLNNYEYLPIPAPQYDPVYLSTLYNFGPWFFPTTYPKFPMYYPTTTTTYYPAFQTWQSTPIIYTPILDQLTQPAYNYTFYYYPPYNFVYTPQPPINPAAAALQYMYYSYRTTRPSSWW